MRQKLPDTKMSEPNLPGGMLFDEETIGNLKAISSSVDDLGSIGMREALKMDGIVEKPKNTFPSPLIS